MKKILVTACILLVTMGLSALTIFEDTFDNQSSKVAGWDRSHSSYVSRYTGSYKKGTAALRLRYNKNAVTYIKCSPFKNMTLKFKLAAVSLEGSENIKCQYSTGGSWKTAKTLQNGYDNGQYRSYSVSIPNCNILKIRFIMTANSTSDYGYVDDVILTGSRK
jgi:hypothetical protein